MYNDEYKLPYDLPSKKTIGGLKSNSTKGGGGFNEWSSRTRRDPRRSRCMPEKDHDVTVRDTETRTIGEAAFGGDTRNTTLKNGNDKLDIQLGGQHITLAMDQSVNAGLSITLMANANITLQVGPSQIILTPAGIVINAPTIAMTAQAGMALAAGGPAGRPRYSNPCWLTVMGQVRFGTVQDLFQAYPLARYDVGKADADKPSLDFLQEAADARNWHPAVSYCAYLLPRRVAVAWGCRSLRLMFDHFDASDTRSLNTCGDLGPATGRAVPEQGAGCRQCQ